MFLSVFPVIDDVIDQLLLIIIVFFRKKNILRAIGNTAPESNITGISSHYLDDTATLMGSRGITNLIDGFHRGVDCGVETDGIIGTGNIQVNGTRNSNGIDSESSQLLRSCEGTVTTDHHQTFDAMLTADLCRLLLSFRCTHLCTTRSIKHGTTTGNSIRHISCSKICDLAVDQAIVSFINTLYLQTFCNTAADNRPDGSIHARCIAAACKNSDCFNRVCHDFTLQKLLVFSIFIIFRLSTIKFNSFFPVFQ